MIDFIELPVFTKQWMKLGLNDEEDLTDLQLTIMRRPRGNPVIKGTDGLRKMRYADARSGAGKRGGFRVLYVYFEPHHIVLLCVVYAKGGQENISPSVKQYLNKHIEATDKELERQRKLRLPETTNED